MENLNIYILSLNTSKIDLLLTYFIKIQQMDIEWINRKSKMATFVLG